VTQRRREKAKIVFSIDSQNGESVLSIVLDVMASLGLDPYFFLHGDRISAKELNDRISLKKAWPSGVVSNGLKFRFGIVTALKHSFLLIEEEEVCAEIIWDDWVTPFLRSEGFVQAWVSDVEYDYWQNARDLLEYEAAGRDCSNLPRKSNGLPPPLEQFEIDISSNPGRSELREGYVEAVGAVMWLGELFWERVGKNRRDVLLSVVWISCTVIESNVVRLVAAERSFYSASTADIQNELRSILFG
jgi:hypothetical protein